MAYGINSSGAIVGLQLGPPNVAGYLNPFVPIVSNVGGSPQRAHAISTQGYVAGYGSGPSGSTQAYVTNGPVIWLAHLPGGVNAIANDVNDLGHVVGYSYAGGTPNATYWNDANNPINLGTPGEFSTAEGLNVNDEVVGFYVPSPGTTRALLWSLSAPRVELLPLTGDVSSAAYDVSSSGLVVGFSQGSHGKAVVWDDAGAVTSLHAECAAVGGSSSTAKSVIDLASGITIVGGICQGRGAMAWLLQPDGSRTASLLLPLAGGNQAVVEDINASGRVVGYTQTGASNVATMWELVLPNLPPSVAIGTFTNNEGNVGVYGVVASDPEGAPLSVIWDFGDGTPPDSGGISLFHTYSDNGTYTIAVAVSDGVNTVTRTTTALIQNVEPTATLEGPSAPVTEGASFTLSLVDPYDPSAPDAAAGFTYEFDCGAGFGAPGGSSTMTCVAAAPGTYTVQGRLSDKDGGTSTFFTSVTSVPRPNTAPTVILGGPYSGLEGAAIAMTATGSDAENDPLTYTWNFGDGGAGSGSTPSHTYSDNGSYTVTVTVSDGIASASASTTATISNVAPVGSVIAPVGATVPQGSFALTMGQIVEPGSADLASLQFRHNCGSGFSPITSSHTATCSRPVPGSVTLRIALRDKDGGTFTAIKSVNVVNVAPTVTLLSPGTFTIPAGGTVTFSASFTDPGTGDNPWNARVRWGGALGVQNLGAVTPSTPFGASKIYPAAGNYSAAVEVTDKYGALHRVNFRVVVQ